MWRFSDWGTDLRSNFVFQRALDSKDNNCADIPGERIFKERILPDIVTWAATYTAVALTIDSLKKDFDVAASSIYKALLAKLERELLDAGECRSQGRKMEKGADKSGGRDPNAAGARAEIAKTEAVLAWEQDFTVKQILHYKLHKDGFFKPVHDVPRTCQLRMYRGNCFNVVDKECEARVTGFCAESMYVDPPWGWFPERNEDKDVYSAEEIAALIKNAILKNHKKIFVITVSCSHQQLSSYMDAISKLDYVAGCHHGVWHKRGQQGKNIPAETGPSLCRDIEPLIYVFVDSMDRTKQKPPKEQDAHFPAWHLNYMKKHPTLCPQNMRFTYFAAPYIPGHHKYQVKRGNAPPATLNQAEKSQAFCSTLVRTFRKYFLPERTKEQIIICSFVLL